MANGQVPQVGAQRVTNTSARRGIGLSSALGSVGAVFSFFLIAEVEFIVLALPLAVAGMGAGLTRLHRVRAHGRRDSSRGPADAPTAVGITLSGLAIGFCVAGLIVAAVT